jgi:hypothetical protein
VLLKLDVEGFEAAALEGARRLLAAETLLGVVMETNDAALVHGRRESEAHERLLAAGLEPVTYAPFERRLMPLGRADRPDANTIYVRDRAQLEARLRAAPAFEVLGRQV